MELVNKSLFIHSAWNIATNKNPLLSAILKAKYHPSDSFWNAPDRGPRSIYWSSILKINHHLNSNSIYQIHNGNSSIWSDPWSPIWNSIHDNLLMPIVNTPLPAKVSDLWIQGTQTWNNNLLSTTFSAPAVNTIESTLLSALIQMISSDGLQLRMVYALLNLSTLIFSNNKNINSPPKDPEV